MVAEIVFLTSHLIFFKYSFAVSARSGNILIIIFKKKKRIAYHLPKLFPLKTFAYLIK